MRSKDLSCFPSIFHFVPCATLNQVLNCTITTMQRGATSMVLNLCTSCQLFETGHLCLLFFCKQQYWLNWWRISRSNNSFITKDFFSDRTLPHFTWAMICVRKQTSAPRTNAWIKAYSHKYKCSMGLCCVWKYTWMYVYTGYMQRYVHGSTVNSTNPASTTTTHRGREYYRWVCEGHANLYVCIKRSITFIYNYIII